MPGKTYRVPNEVTLTLIFEAHNTGDNPSGDGVSMDVWYDWPHKKLPKDTEDADLVCVPADYELAGDQAKDDQGNPVLSQRLSTGELALLVKDVPPLGAKRVIFEKGKPLNTGHIKVGKNTLDNGLVRVLRAEASLKYPANATCLPHRPHVVSSIFRSMTASTPCDRISGAITRTRSSRETSSSDHADR